MSYRTYVLISIFFPGLMPPGFAASGEAVLKPVNGTGFQPFHEKVGRRQVKNMI
jgi:hypothetical protein